MSDKYNTKVSGSAVEQTGDEPFLKRWSRLKNEDGTDGPVSDNQELDGATIAVAGEPEPPSIDPADLPDIESLDGESDYTMFMQEGVPDELRKLALRKLFMSNPALSVLDGLNDYDDDYSKLGIVVETVKTAYKVGRGFLEDEDLVEIDGEGDEEIEEGTGDALIAENVPDTDGDRIGETTAAETDTPDPDLPGIAKDDDAEALTSRETTDLGRPAEPLTAEPAKPSKA